MDKQCRPTSDYSSRTRRAYMRWRVGVICPSLCTYADVHRPEMNDLHGKKWFLFDFRRPVGSICSFG